MPDPPRSRIGQLLDGLNPFPVHRVPAEVKSVPAVLNKAMPAPVEPAPDALAMRAADPAAEEKSSRVAGAILSILGSKNAVWTRQNYDAYAREGYGLNIYVYRCVKMIADACADVPWELFEGTPHGKKTKIDDHPVLDLLADPCPDLEGYTSFMQHYMTYLMLSGNTYMEKVGPGRGRPPRELYPHRPDRIKIVPGNIKDRILCYNYFASAPSVAYTADPQMQVPAWAMLHQKFVHPYDDWYGMAPLQAAARSADQSNASKAWNVSMLQNAARPSGAFTLKEGTNLTPDEFDELQRTIEDAYTGARNAGKPLLMEAELAYQQLSLSPKEMDWLAAQNMSAREIALGFGVPPELVADNSSKVFADTSGNTAYKMFYVLTILPLMRFVRDGWNRFIVADFPGKKPLFLDINRDAIEVLQEDRKILWEYISNATFLTENEKRRLVGMESVPWGETRVFLSSMFEMSTDGKITAALPGIQGGAGGAATPPAPAPAAKKPAPKKKAGVDASLEKMGAIMRLLGEEPDPEDDPGEADPE